MNDVDRLIWTKEQTVKFSDYSKEHWQKIFLHTFSKFEESLATSCYHEKIDEEEFCRGFCVNIWSPPGPNAFLSFTWRGVLGATIIGTESEEWIHISASLFIFINTKRVVNSNSRNYIEYTFKQNALGDGEWTCDDWQDDEYDEFISQYKDDIRR